MFVATSFWNEDARGPVSFQNFLNEEYATSSSKRCHGHVTTPPHAVIDEAKHPGERFTLKIPVC